MRKALVLSLTLASMLGASAAVHADPNDRAATLRARRPAAPGPVPAPAPAPATGGALVPDQGVHNAMHAARQGQIVFTRTDLSLSAITESSLATDFTLGQPIFFRVYTEKSAVNAIALKTGVPARQVYPDGVHYTARFTVDGVTYDTTIKPWGGRNDHLTWTTWRGQLGNPDRVVVPGADAFLELLSRATAAGGLKPGKHSITMEVLPATNTEGGGKLEAGPVARGTFTLTVPAGVITPGNTAVCGPGRGAAGSAAIEARALAVSKQYWTDTAYTPARAIAAGGDWQMELNPITSVPIERTTRVDILSRGAKVCKRQVYRFTEKYMGGGNFSTATGGVSVNFEPGYVPCGCI